MLLAKDFHWMKQTLYLSLSVKTPSHRWGTSGIFVAGLYSWNQNFPAKWIRGVGLISDYSQMAWLIRCPLKLHVPLTRCVQGRGRPPETTQSSLCYATLSFTRIPTIQRKWSQDSSFVYRSQYESLLFLWLKTNTWLMTDDVLFWAPPFSAYLCGGVGSNVSGGWCGTSSRMEPRTLAGGLGGYSIFPAYR